MIHTERTKIHEGNIDVPEMYIMKAARAQTGLKLEHKGKFMELTYSQLTDKLVRRQYYIPRDKDSKGQRKPGYYLYIYKWKPIK